MNKNFNENGIIGKSVLQSITIQFFASFVFVLLILFLSRALLVFSFYENIQEATGHNILLFVMRSWQFDCRVAGMLILPFFVTSVLFCRICKNPEIFLKIFKIFCSCFIVLTAILALFDVGYFKEYNNRYDFWMFNFFFDDRKAVFVTIYKTYNIFIILSAVVILSAVFIFIFRKFLSLAAKFRVNRYMTFLLVPLMFLMLIFAARGSFGRRPLKQADVSITGNVFLNKCVPNSYYALYFAGKEFFNQNNINEIQQNLSDKNLQEAMKVLGFEGSDVDKIIMCKSKGAKLSERPKHIFLIVMESQDNWPLLDENAELNLCQNLSRFSKEGLYFKNFVPAGQGTMSAISVQMCNYPNMGFLLNYSRNGLENCDLSVGTLFQELGYETNFYYGGYLSWQRIDRFAPLHGYQNCYGGDMMGDYTGNEWGVDDEDLLSFVASKLNIDRPSFNLILTVSNHPPYSVDLEKAGAPLDHFAKFVEDKSRVKHLGHAWYADKCLGKFVEKIEAMTDDAIFVITGDHFSRKHYKQQFSIFDEKTVPLVIYGKSFNSQLKQYTPHAGSQIDIVRTVVELIADPGFAYSSFGSDLLSCSGIHEGYCTEVTITDDYIAKNDLSQIEALNNCSLVSVDKAKRAVTRNDAWRMLAKWKFFKKSQ